MKTRKSCMFILMLFLAVILLAFMLIPPVAMTGASYDAGYPAPTTPVATFDVGYPPPLTATPTVDPWCEEAILMGNRPPRWCPPEPWPPVIGEAVLTVAGEPEAIATPAAIVKMGGRQKERGK